MNKELQSLSRRDFARCATGGVAAVVELTSSHGTGLVHRSGSLPPELDQTPAEGAKLSSQSLAEAEARCQAILQQYGERFSDPQKADIRRLCMVAQQSLDAVRAFPVANSQQPALYLKPLVERDRKMGSGQTAQEKSGQLSKEHAAASPSGRP